MPIVESVHSAEYFAGSCANFNVADDAYHSYAICLSPLYAVGAIDAAHDRCQARKSCDDNTALILTLTLTLNLTGNLGMVTLLLREKANIHAKNQARAVRANPFFVVLANAVSVCDIIGV